MNDTDNLQANEALEWIEMAWAARNAASPSLNGARRAWFEGVKTLLRDSGRPAHINLIRNKVQ